MQYLAAVDEDSNSSSSSLIPLQNEIILRSSSLDENKATEDKEPVIPAPSKKNVDNVLVNFGRFLEVNFIYYIINYCFSILLNSSYLISLI